MIIEVPYFKYINQYKLFKMQNRKILEKYDIDLKVYDGLGNSPWNGGRFPNHDLPKKGINVSFAITAHTINDFNHKESHKILKDYDVPGNSIVISNLELLEKLKTIYKNYIYIYSITAFDINQGFDKYQNIEQLVDYIVPRSELIDNIEEFYKLNTEQYILLYSYECSYCPLYTEHYKYIGENINDQSKAHLTKCWFKNKKLFNELKYNVDDYDYEYTSSAKFHHKLTDIDSNVIGGYKIGRNFQDFDKIKDELWEIIKTIEKY